MVCQVKEPVVVVVKVATEVEKIIDLMEVNAIAVIMPRQNKVRTVRSQQTSLKVGLTLNKSRQ